MPKTDKTDTLRRDDTRSGFDEFTTFNAVESEALKRALKRAAERRSADLPTSMEDGEGWLMVPTHKGPRQVAYAGTRAWLLG